MRSVANTRNAKLCIAKLRAGTFKRTFLAVPKLFRDVVIAGHAGRGVVVVAQEEQALVELVDLAVLSAVPHTITRASAAFRIAMAVDAVHRGLAVFSAVAVILALTAAVQFGRSVLPAINLAMLSTVSCAVAYARSLVT